MIDDRSLKELITGNNGSSIRDSYAHQLSDTFSGE